MEVLEPKGTVTSEKEKAQRVWRRTANVRLGPNGHIFDPQVKREHVLESYLSSRLSEKEGEVRRQKGRVEKKSEVCGLCKQGCDCKCPKYLTAEQLRTREFEYYSGSEVSEYF